MLKHYAMPLNSARFAILNISGVDNNYSFIKIVSNIIILLLY